MASSPSPSSTARSASPRSPSPRSIAHAVQDAGWLAHRYDPGHDAFHLLPVSREEREKATFLTDDCLPSGRSPLIVRRADAIAATPPAAPLHFIFHSAYCCSTLLARAFDRPGWSVGLKEPVVLNDIIGWRRRGGQGPDMAAVLNDTLTMLARPFAPGEAVVVKPSTAINALAPAILTLRPDAHALLLYAPLRTYLASIAKKGLEGRLWVRTLFAGMSDDGLARFGFSPRDLFGQTDLQIAALGWLGQHALFAEIVKRFGPDRIRTLDSATLMADPRAAMRDLAQTFALPADDATLDAIIAGPAFTRHSKFGTTFDAEDRAAEHRSASEIHAEEIDKILCWAEKVAGAAGVSLAPPSGRNRSNLS